MELEQIKGIGKSKAEKLKSLKIYCVEDILHYYPYSVKFKDYTDLSNESILVKVDVMTVSRVSYIRKNLNYFSFKGVVDNKLLTFKVFNQPYLNQKIFEGMVVSVEAKQYKNDYSVSKVIINNQVPYVEVKYRSNSNISSKQIQTLIHKTLYEYHEILIDTVPEELRLKYKLLSIKEAVYLIHNPVTNNDYLNALRTLKYNEAYNFMQYVYENKVENADYNFDSFDLVSNTKLIQSLPFDLTDGQKSVLQEIYGDVAHNKRIARLIHGDVGCGKTLVSIISTQLFTSNNMQVAILCPTEILAVQMFSKYSKYIDEGILLTSKTSKENGKEILSGIANGKYKYIVGTHSLLSDKIKFDNLGLVIIDEQHRFGVEQREKLLGNESTNYILMSATPIPRTMALVLFDNVKLSLIEGMPKNRSIVETSYVENINDELIADFKNEIAKGNLIYIVVPAISENSLNTESAESIYEKYSQHFDKKLIGVVHSQISSEEQSKIMNKFISGKIKILIATTVIEVGIDVSNATRIIIHDADRFGLATLHQLRGRVGRSDIDSKCYVQSKSVSERINLFINSKNGFDITEADFKLRGPGNITGVEQSGYNMFKIINVFEDISILEAAKSDIYVLS